MFKLLTCFWTKRFQVLRADLERRAFAAVDDVGDNVFFVGKNYSISVSVAEFPELMGSCVDFTNCIHWLGVIPLGVFDMKDKSVK